MHGVDCRGCPCRRSGSSGRVAADEGDTAARTGRADGTSLAVEKRDPERNATDLWTIDLARGTFSRLTTTPGFENVAAWTPDGRRIAYASDQGNAPGIWIRNASGTGSEELVVKERARFRPTGRRTAGTYSS